MSLVHGINLLFQKLKWPLPQIGFINDAIINFQWANHEYTFFLNGGIVVENLSDRTTRTNHSDWVEGLLSGKIRNDAGELIDDQVPGN